MFLYGMISCLILSALTTSLSAMGEEYTPLLDAYSTDPVQRLYIILMNKKSTTKQINTFFKNNPGFDTAIVYKEKSLLEHAIISSVCNLDVLNTFLKKGCPLCTPKVATDLLVLYYNPPLTEDHKGTQDGFFTPKQRARMNILNSIREIVAHGRIDSAPDNSKKNSSSRKVSKPSLEELTGQYSAWWTKQGKEAYNSAFNARSAKKYESAGSTLLTPEDSKETIEWGNRLKKQVKAWAKKEMKRILDYKKGRSKK